jgi:hypothetical protein
MQVRVDNKQPPPALIHGHVGGVLHAVVAAQGGEKIAFRVKLQHRTQNGVGDEEIVVVVDHNTQGIDQTDAAPASQPEYFPLFRVQDVHGRFLQGGDQDPVLGVNGHTSWLFKEFGEIGRSVSSEVQYRS